MSGLIGSYRVRSSDQVTQVSSVLMHGSPQFVRQLWESMQQSRFHHLLQNISVERSSKHQPLLGPT